MASALEYLQKVGIHGIVTTDYEGKKIGQELASMLEMEKDTFDKLAKDYPLHLQKSTLSSGDFVGDPADAYRESYNKVSTDYTSVVSNFNSRVQNNKQKYSAIIAKMKGIS